MKTGKIILSIITLLFAALGLLKILPYDITHPIMFLALATLLAVRGVEYKKNRDKSGFLFSIVPAIFLYMVVICQKTYKNTPTSEICLNM